MIRLVALFKERRRAELAVGLMTVFDREAGLAQSRLPASAADVSPFGSRISGRLWVDVKHLRSDQVARLEATPANALDVFHHPFAYAT